MQDILTTIAALTEVLIFLYTTAALIGFTANRPQAAMTSTELVHLAEPSCTRAQVESARLMLDPLPPKIRSRHNQAA